MIPSTMIYDDSGSHIGWIENDDAFSATTRKKVACVKNNELFSVDGERLNKHLQNAFRARGQNDTTGYVGWWSSDGTFVTTAGTVADGMWENYAGNGWSFLTPSFDNSQPEVFKVLGRRKRTVPEASTDFTSLSAVPEPSTWAMMMLGFAGLGLAGYGQGRRARAAAVA